MEKWHKVHIFAIGKKANIKYSQIIKPHTGAKKTEMTNRKIDNHIKHYYQTTSNALLVTGARHHALLLQQQEAGGMGFGNRT